ncbi:MAG: gephyrin-like molybdotransferase Glp [bacterium]
MRSVEEHQRIALEAVRPLEPITLPLLDAAGCVLAEEVTAAWPLPSFDNSSMDGYAVLAADVASASPESPVVLDVVDDVPAGYRATERVSPGRAIRIMTGAPLPDGAEAVVPVEATDAGIERVEIRSPVAPGSSIRRAGEDVVAGTPVLEVGTVLTARSIALATAVGKAEVRVHPRPRVVVISTGNELVDPGVPLRHGLIADSNSVMLVTAAREAGAAAFRAGPVPDDEERLMATLDDQLVRADLVVTSGGVSMGAYDTVKAVLSRIGTVEFVKVGMQPGMPQGFGVLGDDAIPIATLPGNPVSAYVSFEVFVRPLIRRMMGFERVHRPVVSAVCTAGFDSPSGKTQFARVQLRVEDGRYVAHPEGAQGSHILGGLARADALAVIPPEVTRVEQGDVLTVIDLGRDEP